MEITVWFEDAKWLVQPNPAVVVVGTPITWILRSPRLTIPTCRWTIYFNGASPFHVQRGIPSPTVNEMRVTSRNTNLGTLTTKTPQAFNTLKDAGVKTEDIVDHVGVVGPVVSEDRGEYKYGIRITNAANDEELGNDDPMLIVR